ncbi:hypothetical protein KUV57_12175 [Epibacterium sp. DP7N7-1]|nr:hypothetical protein [Epibacterium sp. DP7N7-1]
MSIAPRHSEIFALRVQILARSSDDRAFKRAIGDIATDLLAIEAHLERDPDCWRKTRALHAVHVPSLAAAVKIYEQIDRSTDAFCEERDAIFAAFSRTGALFRKARATLDADLASRARIEAEVLADRAPEPVPVAEPASLLGRARARISSFSIGAIDRVSDTAGAALSDLGVRFMSIPKISGSIGSVIWETFSGRVAAPVGIRLAASQRAISDGLEAGTGFGIVIGILCPPLLPIAAGGAVLTALASYSDGVDQLTAADSQEREARWVELREQRAQALRELAHGSSALQIESEDLSVTVDVETGQADAIVLSGPLTGRSYSSLSEAERADIQSSVLRDADRDKPGSGWLLLDILATGASAATLN